MTSIIDEPYNNHFTRHIVAKLVMGDFSLYVCHSTLPRSLFPVDGEIHPFLKNVPLSFVSTNYLDTASATSAHDIVCDNPENFWGKLLNRSRLLRHAVFKLYNVSNSSGWPGAKLEVGGYVDSFTLNPNTITLNVLS